MAFWVRSWLAGWLVVLASACAAPPRTTALATNDTSADVDSRHRNHGGVVRLIGVSLRELPLTPEQRRKLEALREDVIAKMQPIRDLGTELASVLAGGVASGTVDRAKAEAIAAKLHDATLAQREGRADALNRLHATLTPEQREALVDKMQALWARWREEWEGASTFVEPPPDNMDILQGKLGLTPEQMARIHARFAAAMQGVVAESFAEDAAARAQAFGAAFRADAFDAESSEPAPPHVGTFGAIRMTRFFEAFAPELTPAERVTLAQMIRDHAWRHDQP